jgi:hypothetical protein
MSNEVSIFKNGGAVPAHIKNKELSETTKALMGGGTSVRRISLKGNIFRMVVGGQELAKNEDRAMNIIIAAAAPKTSRQFYTGTYQEGVAAIPACWSNNGEQPDITSESPQSANCANCPKNIAGSGQGQGRACRFVHRLAVVLENDVSGGEIYELSLAATSLFGKGETTKMPLFQYVKLLGSNGMDITDVVTEMRFDTDSATPKMIFRAVRPLDVSELEAIAVHGSSPESKMAIKASYSPVAKKLNDGEELTFVQPTAKVAPTQASADEPVVREKKSAPPTPSTMESVLAEWAE